ncbi:hypothetical protein HETIRDRAFT_315454 [Heterobasidion irregulare TC 32-1]|uniref:Uncharacterized protein n=1 Tax=Heterobasidion irregulare (strain TC 32-1) TaxID=747525 RepID=W4K963_HETIT|nr:uncharacterized protein HETIRDRAFT_315454 [Heterobasidion irregulare TC 32-1]ETW82372.1 hypothetical protein HETIRDRAFT_315454 [Heterobasidion irregulare TC 32-1]
MVDTENNAQLPGRHVLRVGTYGIILCLVVGRVMALYTQGGGKSSAHLWQETSLNIGAASYISLQSYEPSHAVLFQAIHGRVASMQSYTFTHLHSDYFLCILPNDPSISQDRRHIHLDEVLLQLFSHLNRYLLNLVAVVQRLQALRWRGAGGKKDSSGTRKDGDGLVHEV